MRPALLPTKALRVRASSRALATASIMPKLDLDNLAYCEINGTLIFLDIAADRYFRLPDERNRELLAQIDFSAGEPWHQPTSFQRPDMWSLPTRASTAIQEGPFQLAGVARAIWAQRRIERRISSRSLAHVLADLGRIKETRKAARLISHPKAVSTIRAFEQARLLRTSANRCLPRSLALASCLAAQGFPVRLIIGVKLSQFGAHCWVQSGDDVLNDTAEEVLRYRPILVI
jgi:hypothetical protein